MQSRRRNIPPRPTPAAEAALWAAYAQARSIPARNAIVEAFIALAYHIAERFHHRLPKSVLFDELASAATLGLIRAVETFDPARNAAFKSYAAQKIRSFILDDIRANDWVPRNVRSDTTKLDRAGATLAHELGRAPTPEELAEKIGVTPERITYMQRRAATAFSPSLSASTNNEDDPILQPAQSREADPAEAALNRIQFEQFLSMVAARDREVLRLRFIEGLTQREVAACVGRSEAWASQRCSLICRKIRENVQKLTRQAA